MYDENGYVNDPQLLEMLNNPLSGKEASTEAFPVNEEPAEDGSILTTAGKHLKRMSSAYLAANVSPEFSNYANARMERSSRELKEEQAKLGVAGNIAAGAISALPAIGLGIANPYAGAAAAMTMGTGEALARQYEDTGEFDKGSAYLGGAAMGAIDLATGKAANLARAGLAGRAAGQALPTTAPLAQRVGVNLTEDVTSNVGGDAMINLASGRDWDEGLTESAIGGAVAGTALRGSLAGLNKATNTPLNEWGKGSIESVQNLFKRDLAPNKTYTDEVVGYNNLQKDLQDKIQNEVDPSVRSDLIEASINMSSRQGGQAADIMMMKMADEYGLTLTDGAFDVNFTQGLSRGGPEYNLGQSVGLTGKQMQASARQIENVQPVRFGRDKLATKNLTKETDQQNFQDTYKKIDGIMKGSYSANISEVGKMIREAEFSPNVTQAEIRELSKLQTALRGLERDMQSYTGNKKTDTSIDIQNNAREAIRIANELGIANRLMGVDGKAGSWDPIAGVMAIDRLERVARQRMPNVHQGTPSSGKDQAGKGAGGLGTALDVAGLVTGNIWAPMARHAGKSIIARKSIRDLRKNKERGTARVKGLIEASTPKSRAEAGLQAGDISAAAKGAEADLAEVGLTPPVTEPSVVPTQVAPEAPTTTVEPTVAKTAPVPTRAPKARQEPVQEPTPAPAPQPEKMARKPRTIKKAGELAEAKATKDKVDEMDGGIVEPITNKVEVQDVTPKKSRALSPDKIAKAEKAPEPTPEAPKKPVDSSEIARKPATPKKEEKLTEEPTEAPKKVEEESPAVEEKPKTSSTELVTNPLKKKADRLDNMSPKERAALPTEELRELRRAKEDLQEVESLSDSLSSQFKTTKDEIMSHIKDAGGMDGLRKANKEAGHKDSNVRQFLANRIREIEDLKKAEVKDKLDALRTQVKEKVAPVKGDDSIASSKLADKHGTVRSRLEASGYDKEIIDEALKRGGASDTSKDFDVTTVNKWAQTLNKEKVAKAKEEAKTAEDAAKVAAEAAKKKDQKWLVDQYLKGLKVDKEPELRELANKMMNKGRNKPLSEQQMQTLFNRIDSYLENQKNAYEASFKAGTGDSPLDKAKSATYASMQKTLRENQKKADAQAEEARLATEQATKEAQQKTADYEKLFTQAEKNMKKFDDIKALDKQIREMTDSLIDMDAPEQFVQQAIHNTFIKRDTPLNDRELNKARAKVVNELEKLMNAEVSTAKAQVKPEIKKMSDGELIAAREEVMSSTVENISEPQNQALVQSISEELQTRGLKKEQEIISTYNEVVTKAEHMQKLYPDNPEWWIPADAVDAIQRSFGKGDSSSFAGPLLRRLREKFYGTSEGTDKYYRNNQRKIDREVKGKEATGLGDVIVK